MAFASFSPVDIDEMLSQLATWTSTALGWTSNWSGGQLTLEPKVGEAVFTLSSEPDSYLDTGVPQLVLLTSEGTESFETVLSHVYSTSVCWLFGGAEPEPWLHIIIQVTPGTYRHAYLGYLERYGTWTGGAICDANQVGRLHASTSTSAQYYAFDHAHSHTLFSQESYWEYGRPVARLGGVMVGGHGEAGQKGHARFGNFDNSTHRVPLDTPVAGGGPVENYAQAVANPGVAPYSGEAPLAPITIFADITRNGNWTPLGRVCGIRLVNIDDFSPEQEIAYAGRTWRVFPLVRKPPSTTYEPHSGNRGIALLQDEA